jgi:DNA-binding XRE family transcriptional regulator
VRAEVSAPAPSGGEIVTKRPALQTFGRRIQAARKCAGLSQDALAEATGLHRTYVSLVERDPGTGAQLVPGHRRGSDTSTRRTP